MAAPGGPRTAAPASGGAGAGNVKAVRAQLELADQDCLRISAPDYTTPFKSLEDAVDRLLPYHVFGAEDPQAADIREAEAQGGTVLATTRQEAWQDYVTSKVGEYGQGLALLEKQIQKAEVGALQRSQLPLLMLQSYATAEAQAMMVAEQRRPAEIAAEKEKARQAELKRQEDERQAALLAQQQRQQALMQQQMALQQQQLLAQQQAQQQVQRQAAAAAAAAAQQQAAAAQLAAQQQQQQRQQQQALQPPPGMVPQTQGMPMMAAAASMGQQAIRPPGAGLAPAQAAPLQQGAPGGKPMSAADAKAKQLAALAARISQRK